MSVFPSINPATGEVEREYPEIPAEEFMEILGKTWEGFHEWSHSTIETRVRVFQAMARSLREAAPQHAAMITREMGKPISEARAEIEKCAGLCDYYAEQAPALLGDTQIEADASDSRVCWRPLGVVLAIMPWNFPFWQVFRAAVPALLMGNTVLLKHAPNVCGCALSCEAIMQASGLPLHAFRAALISPKTCSLGFVDARVRGITFTGSGRAGETIGAQAGSQLKKTVLELGGSDPYIVLADADLDHAARTCAQARMRNGGQSCIAAKRFIVVEDVLAPFTERLVAAMQTYEPADPSLDATRLGPLARRDLRDGLHAQVRRSIAAGAEPLLGAFELDGPGWFYPPTVLANCRSGMPVFDQETFGPVAAICPARDEADAVRLANQSIYGLGAAIFTKDTTRARHLAADHIEAGFVAINRMVSSDPRLPFGGVKCSGHGRELGALGPREFANAKTIVTD